MRLFDCHCHYHLGPGGVAPLLAHAAIAPIVRADDGAASSFSFAGAALMSTHPRDYPAVDSVASRLRGSNCAAVRCYGVHPWFLHEVSPDGDDGRGGDGWLAELRRRLSDQPGAIVGEIGLDGARWKVVDGTDATGGVGAADAESGESVWERERTLSSPMDVQKRAFESQLALATELRRPVSIHVVRAWGELLDSLGAVRDEMRRRRAAGIGGGTAAREGGGGGARDGRSGPPRRNEGGNEEAERRPLLLPPKIYFHAFSGKAGVIPSLLAACERGNVPRGDVYFGFAPVRSIPAHARNHCFSSDHIRPS
jgi:Tat protein secretion system quality control protein TatD with DNase activity